MLFPSEKAVDDATSVCKSFNALVHQSFRRALINLQSRFLDIHSSLSVDLGIKALMR